MEFVIESKEVENKLSKVRQYNLIFQILILRSVVRLEVQVAVCDLIHVIKLQHLAVD